MFIINYQGQTGRPLKSRSSSEAIRAGEALEATGHQGVTITDESDGQAMPLDWWQKAAAGVSVKSV